MFTLALRTSAIACLVLLVGAAISAGGQGKSPPLGRFRGDIADPATNAIIMRVALQAPEKLPSEKHLGLLLLFHGFQGNENNYIGLTVEALKRLQLLDQYVVISGKSKGPGWTTEDDERVLRLVRWARETYPIDARRIFLFGSSNGAAFVGRFGWAHQDLVAGVVGYCGSYKFGPDARVDGPAVVNRRPRQPLGPARGTLTTLSFGMSRVRDQRLCRRQQLSQPHGTSVSLRAPLSGE